MGKRVDDGRGEIKCRVDVYVVCVERTGTLLTCAEVWRREETRHEETSWGLGPGPGVDFEVWRVLWCVESVRRRETIKRHTTYLYYLRSIEDVKSRFLSQFDSNT